jgi:cell division septal protein FtsQ
VSKAKRVGVNQRKQQQARRQTVRRKASGFLAVAVRLVVVVALVGSVVWGGAKLVQNARVLRGPLNQLTVKRIEVRGASHLSKEFVIRVAQVDRGKCIFDVKPREVSRALLQQPWIKKASVRRTWWGTVVITIKQRTPVALLNRGVVYQMDEEGVLLPLDSGRVYTLPVVSGLDAQLDARGCGRLFATSLARYSDFMTMAQAADAKLLKRVTQIDFSADEVVRLTLEGSAATVLLSRPDVHRRFGQLGRLLGETPGVVHSGVRVVNLCYSNLAYIR